MENLENQIAILTNKVETMSDAIDRLNSKLSSVEPQSSPIPPPQEGIPNRDPLTAHHSYTEQLSDIPMLDHKDVLADDEYDRHRDRHDTMSETYLSPELQIQRLTAQLTAAYNRIAALEEQLLSKRIHL
ncbi:hypothetical protein [Roseofilum casamattae]|uniref:Uncharacterized protein n=1 Tax=Roseofilum casamattae BLCC-M143 TaxID=3022442 RepID=A0ABT7BW62_9CYAN|nr:hypothetical protein [Roseofilum casamattae]MDJ1182498.1 hypothetical protein [Roseofilum casamattae BLCC-M143]